MVKTKAQIESQGNSISLIYGKNSLIMLQSDFERLIDEHITKNHFVEMAEAMIKDYLAMDGYDWNYDQRELERRLAIIYDNII